MADTNADHTARRDSISDRTPPIQLLQLPVGQVFDIGQEKEKVGYESEQV